MTPRFSTSRPGFFAGRARAFTLLELLTTIAIIAVLAALLLPALQNSYRKARRIACASQLKQVGTAFHSWAHDHNDLYPMQVSTNQGGSKEYADQTAMNPDLSFAFRHFQTVSNELLLPKVLLCPAEKTRVAAADFASLQNENISYWLNHGAVFGRPDSPLAGDRNVRTSGRMEWAFVQFGGGDKVEFSAELHGHRGNVLFGDAHVDTLDSQALGLAFAQITNASSVTLALPARELPPEPVPAVVVGQGGGQAVVGGGGGAGAVAAPPANQSGPPGVAASSTKPMAFGHNSGPPTLDNGGTVYAGVELVVFTKLDGTYETSAVPRRYTNVTTAATRVRPPVTPEIEKSHPLVDFAQSMTRKAQRQFHWLLLILALLIALNVLDKMRRRVRGRRRGAV